MGMFSGVKKAFKKITTNKVFMIAAVAVAAAAVVFTAGAALGVAPLAAGCGGAMTGLAGSMGLTGTAASVVAGALTQAGYGAAIGFAGGGLMSSLSGGSFMKGAMQGAGAGLLTGAVTGGITGAIAPATPAATIEGGIGTTPGAETIAGGSGVDTLAGSAGADTLAGAQGAGMMPVPKPTMVPASQVASPVSMADPTAANAAADAAFGSDAARQAVQGTQGKGFLSGLLDSETLGKGVSGLAQGWMRGQAEEGEAESMLARDEVQRAFVTDNYAGAGNQKLGAATFNVGRLAYNPVTGRIERSA